MLRAHTHSDEARSVRVDHDERNHESIAQKRKENEKTQTESYVESTHTHTLLMKPRSALTIITGTQMNSRKRKKTKDRQEATATNRFRATRRHTCIHKQLLIAGNDVSHHDARFMIHGVVGGLELPQRVAARRYARRSPVCGQGSSSSNSSSSSSSSKAQEGSNEGD